MSFVSGLKLICHAATMHSRMCPFLGCACICTVVSDALLYAAVALEHARKIAASFCLSVMTTHSAYDAAFSSGS